MAGSMQKTARCKLCSGCYHRLSCEMYNEEVRCCLKGDGGGLGIRRVLSANWHMCMIVDRGFN